VEHAGDGAVEYSPGPWYRGTDMFTYAVRSSDASAQVYRYGTVAITVE
jgi:hypothetical protein